MKQIKRSKQVFRLAKAETLRTLQKTKALHARTPSSTDGPNGADTIVKGQREEEGVPD